MKSFTQGMWEEIAPIFRANSGPAVQSGAGSGTLGARALPFYMIQDAHYLGAFSRALATTAAKAETAEAQVKLAGSAKDAILVERALHEGFFREFGVSPEQFAATPSSPTCSGYSDFLQATAFRHPCASSRCRATALFPDLLRGRQAAARDRRAGQSLPAVD